LGESILLVEDDVSLRDIVAKALLARGYEVLRATDGRNGLRQASDREPDLVVLDLGLPDIDGIDVCRSLRRWFQGSILILSADGDDQRKVLALDEGADDYVTKPFSMTEFLARVRVSLRHRRASAAALVADEPLIEFGDLRIDAAAYVVMAGDRRLDVSAKEYAILKCLALRPEALVTHRVICEAVWGTAERGRRDTLRVHLTRLRTKLGTGPRRPTIVTEYGVGYRMVLSNNS
jgi:two-component system KDP operon response regulator KdpE